MTFIDKNGMRITGEDVESAGRKIYEEIREEMEADHWGKLVVIDVHSGDYEVGDFKSRRSDIDITNRLRERHPDALTWAELVGHPAPYHRNAGRAGMNPVTPERKIASD